jgi:hypothetical protein
MRILRGTLVGGISFFLLGWLVYGILLMDLMMGYYNTSLNRPETEMIWWAILLSNFITGLMLTIALKWSGATDAVNGLKIGALFGFLLSLGYNLSMYSMTTMFNSFMGLVIDVLVFTVLMAVIGMLIILLWGKDK